MWVHSASEDVHCALLCSAQNKSCTRGKNSHSLQDVVGVIIIKDGFGSKKMNEKRRNLIDSIHGSVSVMMMFQVPHGAVQRINKMSALHRQQSVFPSFSGFRRKEHFTVLLK